MKIYVRSFYDFVRIVRITGNDYTYIHIKYLQNGYDAQFGLGDDVYTSSFREPSMLQPALFSKRR